MNIEIAPETNGSVENEFRQIFTESMNTFLSRIENLLKIRKIDPEKINIYTTDTRTILEKEFEDLMATKTQIYDLMLRKNKTEKDFYFYLKIKIEEIIQKQENLLKSVLGKT